MNRELQGKAAGLLCIKTSWPGQARTYGDMWRLDGSSTMLTPSVFCSIFGDHERFEQVYYRPCPGYYFSGDGCKVSLSFPSKLYLL